MCLVSLESTKPTEFEYVYNRTNKTHKKKNQYENIGFQAFYEQNEQIQRRYY